MEGNTPVQISDRLRSLRESLGYTQAEVAARSGLSAPFVSTIESGRVDLRMSTVTRYLDAIGSTLEVAPVRDRPIRLEDVVRLADRGRERVLGTRLGASDPTARLEAKRRAGRDITVERRAIGSR